MSRLFQCRKNDIGLYDRTGHLFGAVVSVPDELRDAQDCMMEPCDTFRAAMQRKGLTNADRRGDFDCAEYGISYGGGRKVSCLLLHLVEQS